MNKKISYGFHHIDDNDIEAVVEVSSIIKEIKEGWDSIPVDQRIPAV